jgi:cytochrome bd-type quinol oxidase subunit 2
VPGTRIKDRGIVRFQEALYFGRGRVGLVATGSFLALAGRGSLWAALKTEGKLQERTRSFGAKRWVVSVATTLLISAASFSIQPNVIRQIPEPSLG